MVVWSSIEGERKREGEVVERLLTLFNWFDFVRCDVLMWTGGGKIILFPCYIPPSRPSGVPSILIAFAHLLLSSVFSSKTSCFACPLLITLPLFSSLLLLLLRLKVQVY